MCACATYQERKEGYRFRPCTCYTHRSKSWKLTRWKNDGCLNFVDENDEVLISGFGRSGKAKGDIPGVRFKVVKVSGVGLLALWKEKKVTTGLICASAYRSDSITYRKSQGHNRVFYLLCLFWSMRYDVEISSMPYVVHAPPHATLLIS